MPASFLPSKGQVQVALLRLVSLLPLGLGRCLGRVIGRMISFTDNYNTRITQENIVRCFPHLDESEKRGLIRSSLEHTGMLSIEMAMVWCKPTSWLEQRILKVSGIEIFEAALAQGTGVIMLAPHLGNWEVVGQYIASRYPMMNMYTPPKIPEMDALISEGRNKTGSQLAPANQRGLVMLLKHLKAGHTIGILPDQVPDDKNRGSIIAPFFAQPAHTMTLVTQMLKKVQCQIVVVVAVRVKGGFELQITAAPQGLYSEDTQTSVSAMNQTLQALIEKIPEQYQWEYKRFKGIK